MEKYIEITVGSDQRLVRVSDIVKIIATSTTVTTITYEGGATAALTHTAATGAAQVVALETLVEKALRKPWSEPVLATVASDLDKPVSAIA